MAGIEDVSGHHGHNEIRERWEHIDNKIIKQILVKQSGMRVRGQSIVDVFNKLNEKDAADYLHRHGSFVVGPLQEDGMPSVGSYQEMNRPHKERMHIPTSDGDYIYLWSPNHHNSRTCASMASYDSQVDDFKPQDNKPPGYQRSESFFNHLVEDHMLQPRSKVKNMKKYMLPDTEPEHIYHHNERMHLRKVITSIKNQQWQQQHNHQHNNQQNNNTKQHSEHKKKKRNKTGKSVSFVMMENEAFADGELPVVKDQRHNSETDISESSSQPRSPVVFTVGDKDDQEERNEPTAVEASLPWKRSTGREAMSYIQTHSLPSDGEAQPDPNEPLWIKQADYQEVPPPNGEIIAQESTQVKSAKPDPVTTSSSEHVSIDIEINSKSEDTSPRLPPPWRPTTNNEAPVPSPSVTSMEDALRPDHHNHQHSPSPPQHFLLSEAASRHSEHVHVMPMIDPEAEPRELSVANDNDIIILGGEDDEEIDPNQRVSQWLIESDGTGQDPEELEDDFNFVIEDEFKSRIEIKDRSDNDHISPHPSHQITAL